MNRHIAYYCPMSITLDCFSIFYLEFYFIVVCLYLQKLMSTVQKTNNSRQKNDYEPSTTGSVAGNISITPLFPSILYIITCFEKYLHVLNVLIMLFWFRCT